jgi:hypothetical protein
VCKLVKANETYVGRRTVVFDLRQGDGITPANTEAGGQPQISTNTGSGFGAWTNTGIGTLTFIGNGRYQAVLTQNAVSTAGWFIETRYMSAGTAETPGDSFQVVGFNPADPQAFGILGARTVTITVLTNGNNLPIPNAVVRLTSGTLMYAAPTNSSGVVTFNIDDGTWSVAITKSGYSFPGDSEAISGNTTITYFMDVVSIIPSAPGFTTGYITAYDQNGLPEANVSFSIQAREGISGVSLDETIRTAVSDSNGLAQFSNMVKGAVYFVWRGTSPRKYTVTIPASAGANYALPSVIGAP